MNGRRAGKAHQLSPPNVGYGTSISLWHTFSLKVSIVTVQVWDVWGRGDCVKLFPIASSKCTAL